jgi:hypothetical protein
MSDEKIILPRGRSSSSPPPTFAIPNDHPAILTTYNAGESVTLDPHDVVQAMIEEIKKLSAEVAAMKSMLEARGFTVINGQWARTEETV